MFTFTILLCSITNIHNTKTFSVKADSEDEAIDKTTKMAGMGYQVATVIKH